jgi:selenocysteine-specific elongation factor
MHVVGTAGHVDHGKSSLVEALTGINPDRLEEEQRRQMTIDLGFAWLTLPSGQEIGLVDVPGHRDFIENMLAGVGGIDAVLLVIAADEGVMPQTVEHVDIIELLGVERAVVVLTKIDLVQDLGWLDLVEEDVGRLLENTGLAGASIVRASARTGQGLDEVATHLDELMQSLPVREDLGRPRLSIDRVFTISGFGTVVTGTLVGGSFSVGDEVEILPAGLRARIRGLQTHRNELQKAVPGSRVAINLAGIDVDQVRRGDAVVLPGTYAPTGMLDAHFRQLADAPVPLKQNQSVKVFIGAAQQMGTARLLGGASLIRPGESGWLQIQLNEPMVAAKGDRLVIRRPSPSATLGGGQVADVHPVGRHRAKDSEVVAALERSLEGAPEDQLAEAVARLRAPTLAEAAKSAGLTATVAQEAARQLVEDGRARAWGQMPVDETTRLVSQADWSGWRQAVLDSLQAYHASEPMRSGMPQEALRVRIGLDADAFAFIIMDLAGAGEIIHDPPELRLAGFAVTLSARQQRKADELLEAFGRTPGSPPSMKEAVSTAGEDVVRHLLKQGELVFLADDVLLSRAIYDQWVGSIRETLAAGKTLTVAQARDEFGSSRKYVLALLEHLDREGLTLREGDVRRLNPGYRE